MKYEIQVLLRDLKTAVILRESEAVNIVLDGMLQLPGIKSNDLMTDSIIEELILPAGSLLGQLPNQMLQPLSFHPLAVGRGIGAAAYAHQFINSKRFSDGEILKLANDKRPDVRRVLGRALKNLCSADPEKTFSLATKWIQNPSPRIRSVVLIFLPALAKIDINKINTMVQKLVLDEDQEVRYGLAEALAEIGNTENAIKVLDFLKKWSQQEDPNVWVICRSLSKSWAASYPSEVKSILLEVQSRTKEEKTISKTIRALKRHGLDLSF